MIRPALSALPLLLLLSACGPSGSKGADNTASSSNATSPADQTELEAAFAAAFPHGATVQEGSNKLTYVAKRLVPISSDIEALIAEGSNQSDCHACTGGLKIVYLSRAGGALTPVGKPAGWSLGGAGFGAPPSWSVDRASGVPVLTTTFSEMNQGCTDTTIDVFRLDPKGLKKDAAASKPMTESCQSESDNDAASGNQTAAGAEVDSPAAQVAGANANWASYYREHPDEEAGDDGLPRKKPSAGNAPTRSNSPGAITNPTWLQKPTGDDMARYYPEQAQRLEKEGKVSLHCTVTARGTLTDCTVDEDPPGFGFGDATLHLVRLFKMAPQTADGQSVAGSRVATVVFWGIAK